MSPASFGRGEGGPQKPKAKLPNIGQGQYIRFKGSLAGGSKAASYEFTVLAGENAPTVTDGFSNWNQVQRLQQVAVTTLAGYDPYTMTVPVRFDCYQQDWLDTQNGNANLHAAALEQDIQKLEWMGGRGKLFGPTGVGIAGVGDSPLVRVASIDSAGKQTPLIPPNAQGVQWVVSGIDYDTSPIRNAAGYRTRQDVTVTLMQWVQDQFSASADSSSARAVANGAVSGQYKTYTTTSALNTVQKLAAKVAPGDPTAASQILAANKSNTRIGTSVNKQLPTGTKLKVPLTVIQGLS